MSEPFDFTQFNNQQTQSSEPGSGPTEPVASAPAQQNRAPYADYLEQVPEAFRPQVEPAFKEWDANVTKRFQEVQQQIVPYRDIISEYDPESIQQAIQLANLMQENPQQVYQALGAAYGYGNEVQQSAGQGGMGQQFQQQSAELPEEYADLPPQFLEQWQQTQAQMQQMGQMQELIGQALVQERQQAEEAQQMQQFEQYLGNLKQQFGDYDEDYVLAKIAGGMDPEQAVQNYQQKFGQLVQQQTQQNVNQAVPTVLRAGGGLPTTQQDVTNLSRPDTKALVTQMLEAANRA